MRYPKVLDARTSLGVDTWARRPQPEHRGTLNAVVNAAQNKIVTVLPPAETAVLHAA